MIRGIGTDLVLVSRIEAALGRQGERFARRILTPDEFARFADHGQPARFLAKRFAAKEAIMKVLGTGFVRGIGWQDIEVLAEKNGKPYVKMQGGAGEHARRIGIDEVLITISHCRTYATATAIGVASPSDGEIPL